MIVTLKDTTAAEINAALIENHRETGGTALVHTLITICDSAHYDSVLDEAIDAAREHPARVLMVVHTGGRNNTLDAEIQTSETTPGDVIVLRLSGEIAEHADSVVLPLLLPDSPVIAWWPYDAPKDLAADTIGRLATRRISDCGTAKDSRKALEVRSRHLSPGDSDLCWARITSWRALAAAALDQRPSQVRAIRVEADPTNGPTSLLTAWLALKLDIPVERVDVKGPGGIISLALTTAAGDIEIRRTNGRSAVYRIPGEPARGVALDRRSIGEVMAEELRRLDPDPVQAEVMEALHNGIGQPEAGQPASGRSSARSGKPSSASRKPVSSAGSAAKDQESTK
ncbi:glucose-6-phosphate dehydrogenase assembly protein OpcA [Acidipropionibacterium jensenii]|uniref:glucose-6-phosphate dehydrogenase assembly protein OpcA n=1 Tax=Acidipropionibacterium jensenii TaxID=1749 RepID=UPI00214C64F7|nr:glucose-6-phosphate dehydrogenase assembly protein OpcA [Acidipropionibacterium jensenii]